MNFFTNANPAKPTDISNAELLASGIGGGPWANRLGLAINAANTNNQMEYLDFCIFFRFYYLVEVELLVPELGVVGVVGVDVGVCGGGGPPAND